MICGGENLVSAPPAFSDDAKKLLVCTGNTVSVFSTSTGLLITELEGHTDRVTSVVVVPVESEVVAKFSSFCWTASLDATIRYWDFSVPEMLKKIELQTPVFSMVIPKIQSCLSTSSKKPPGLHAIVSIKEARKESAIRVCDLTSMRLGAIMTETRRPQNLTLSPSGEYVGIVNKRKIHIWRVPSEVFDSNSIKMIKLHHTRNFSALAFHPTERIIAGGDISGRILVWRGFGSVKFFGKKNTDDEVTQVKIKDDADLSPTTWHWHATEVKFLSFSSDGSYLYSGGKEGVIVVWQLDTGKKRFKPRLGSPLLYFSESKDPSLCCVSCADNQIHLMKIPQMEISTTMAGIKLPFSYPEIYGPSSNGLTFDRSAGVIALRAQNYCVQFFSLFDNLELFQVQICERNYQPVDDVMIVLALLALSNDGSVMGSVEIKLPEEEVGGLVTLKFWFRGSDAEKGYMLSTVIYEPHCDSGISAIIFHPNNRMAVTTSFGGDFKVWVHTSDAQKLFQSSCWRCQSIGTYKKKPMTAAAFSADGSVLAIAAETEVTLWDPKTNTLITIVGDTSTPVTALSFIGGSRYLVTTSQGLKPQLAVWNLSNLSLHWSYKLRIESVSCNDDGNYLAVLVLLPEPQKDQDGLILLFNVEHPVPTATWSVKKAKGGQLAFIQANSSSRELQITDNKTRFSMLAYINNAHEYIVFDPLNNGNNQISTKSQTNHVPMEESADQIGYTSIYGELPEFNLNQKNEDQDSTMRLPRYNLDQQKDRTPLISYTSSERPWERIFTGSSHALPSMTNLFSVFMESMFEKTPTSTNAKE